MKILETYDDKCIGCYTCMTACSNLFFKEEDVAKSCIEVFPTEGTENFRLSVCNQCGTCVDVCPAEALSVNKQGVIMLNKKLCSGCFVCVDACPTANFRTHPDLQIPFKCTACGVCARECPADALEVVTA
ncbi:MAG: 4Fe-4S dicluster domain-containing protein [bacterium]|nr:4Fe-4S dicluster domain-containing protein [bacterium]